MKIYGHFVSPPANQVRLTASALGIDHEYVHVDLQNQQHKSPEYLKINPYGKVPAMDDDGFTLSESGAICRYMACKQDCEMYPNDIRKRAEVDQWMDYSAHHIRSNMAKMLFNKIVAPMVGAPVNNEAIEEGRGFLNDMLPAVDAALERNGNLTGETLTIADTAMMAAMEPFEAVGYDVSPFKNVVKCRQNNMAQDWYKNVHTQYMAEMQG